MPLTSLPPDVFDGTVVPVAVVVMGMLLVYVTWALRGLLKEVRAELDTARAERETARGETAAEREIANDLRREVGRLRRVVSSLIVVIADAGLPVPDEAYEEVGL